MAVDVKKLFNEELKGALARNGEAARKIGGVYQINVTGAGSWGIDLSKDPVSVTEGTAATPSVTIDVAEADFQTLYSNPADATKLFFAGKLKVKGNQMQALNLQKLFALK